MPRRVNADGLLMKLRGKVLSVKVVVLRFAVQLFQRKEPTGKLLNAIFTGMHEGCGSPIPSASRTR